MVLLWEVSKSFEEFFNQKAVLFNYPWLVLLKLLWWMIAQIIELSLEVVGSHLVLQCKCWVVKHDDLEYVVDVHGFFVSLPSLQQALDLLHIECRKDLLDCIQEFLQGKNQRFQIIRSFGMWKFSFGCDVMHLLLI